MNKICVVTGANGGIGKAVATALAKRGATVVLLCRNRERGEAARDEILSVSGNATLSLFFAELSDQTSIRQVASELGRKYDHLDVLIHTAAVFKAQRIVTPDGLEMMFASNHLGPFLLTNLLIEGLKAAPIARLLTVSAPSTVKLDFDDLQSGEKFSAGQAFGASKAANLLFAFALARRLEGTHVTSNAIHPGLIKSSLMQEFPFLLRWMLQLMSRPPEVAGDVIADYALSPEFEKLTSGFLHNGKEIEAPAYTRQVDIQDRLWDISAKLTGLQ